MALIVKDENGSIQALAGAESAVAVGVATTDVGRALEVGGVYFRERIRAV
jgi:hypothetical protein